MLDNNSKSNIENSTFTPPHPLKTAVLFLVFNRLDTTKQVFQAIREAKPPRLYIAADGARESKEGEAEKVKAVRDYILQNIDWDCEVKTLFREKNLGCKIAVSSAITWFFENEEMGIILEDDCLPSQSFFWFCEELLVRYRDDTRIGQISGFNPLVEFDFNGASYGFSKFGPIWGWASWSRVWKKYDVNIKKWKKIKKINQVDFFTDNNQEKQWRIELFDRMYNKEIDTWDYQWSFVKLIESQLSIIPFVNLIKNIGFGEDATHTVGVARDSFKINFEIKEIVYQDYIMRNKKFDNLYLSDFVGLNIMNRFKNKGKKMIKKMLDKIIRKKIKWNTIVDQEVNSIQFEQVIFANKRKINVASDEIRQWLKKGNLHEFNHKKIHKKGLEFFFSSYLLDFKQSDILLDAAGGRSNYLKAVKLNHKLNSLYLTDHIYEGVKELSDGIKVVGGDISAIHLEDESVDKIACHHAFEHFQKDKDIDFIIEAYRLLKNKGMLVIIPLFLTDKYVECWNIENNEKFDKNAQLIIDKTASIPGADDDGHFARFYDNDNLISRIIDLAEKIGFVVEIIECEVDGLSVPDMEKNFGSIINKPTRALVLKKK